MRPPVGGETDKGVPAAVGAVGEGAPQAVSTLRQREEITPNTNTGIFLNTLKLTGMGRFLHIYLYRKK